MIYAIIGLSITVVALLFYCGYFYLLARLGEEMLKSKDSMILSLRVTIQRRNRAIYELKEQVRRYKLRADPVEWVNYYFLNNKKNKTI